MSAACAVVGLFVGSPYLFLDFLVAVNGFAAELSHYSSGHPGHEGGAFAANLSRLALGFGPLLLFIPFAAFTKKYWPIIVFCLAYVALVSVPRVHFERNLAPLVPAISILAVVGCGNVRNLWSGVVGKFATLGVFSLFATLPLLHTFEEIRSYDPDSLRNAGAWIDQAIEPEARVLIEAYSPFIPPRDRKIESVIFLFDEHSATIGDSQQVASLAGGDALGPLDNVVLTRRGSFRFAGNESIRPVFQAWFKELEARSCAKDFYPATENWTYLLLTLQCDLEPSP